MEKMWRIMVKATIETLSEKFIRVSMAKSMKIDTALIFGHALT